MNSRREMYVVARHLTVCAFLSARTQGFSFNGQDFDYHRLMLLRSVPDIGEILSLVILYELHNIDRFPSMQDFLSYCRLVKCKKESAGKT